MLKIKLTIPGQPKNIDISKFIGSLDNQYKDYKFFINSGEQEVDFWFIFEDLPENGETSFVNTKNIFFLTAEACLPYNWFNRNYYDLFFSQFDKIYTCYPIYKNNVIPSIPFLPWMINSNHDSIFSKDKRDINFLRKSIINKKKNISVICSYKEEDPGHNLRFNFVKKIKEYFGDTLDWYGNGINQVSEKWTAIAPYKYHIVLENRSDYNFITEKIYDSFLGNAFPIYWGAPNIDQFFSTKSFEAINILDFKGSIKVIEDTLKSNLYETRQKELNVSRELVLTKYNLFTRITEIAQSNNMSKGQKSSVHLNSAKHFQKLKKFYYYFSPKKQINLIARILKKALNLIIRLTDK